MTSREKGRGREERKREIKFIKAASAMRIYITN